MKNKKTKRSNFLSNILNKKINIIKQQDNKDELFKFTYKQDKGKIDINNKKISFMIIVFIIIILFLTGCSIGKTITDVILNSQIEVAKPILEVKSNPEIDVTALNNVGKYEFRVLNYNNEGISEVNLKYFIEISANIDDSIKLQLYKNGEEIKLNNLCTDYMLAEKGKKHEEVYLLKVIYTKQENKNMEDILEKIQIKIHSEQQKI